MPDQATATCSIHRGHNPRPAYAELHHVIPRAWQTLWQPPGAPPGVLWDARTVAICPTGHRNVHYYLVKIVKTHYADLSSGGPISDDTYQDALIASEANAGLPRGHKTEIATALLALQRWYAAGGLVKTLGDAQEWGEA